MTHNALLLCFHVFFLLIISYYLIMSQVLLKKKFTCSTHLNTYFSVGCVIFESESKTTAATISIYPWDVFLIKRGNKCWPSGEFFCCFCSFPGQTNGQKYFKYQGQQFSNAGVQSHFLEISDQERIDRIL